MLKKIVFSLSLLLLQAASANAIIFKFGKLNASAKTCVITGWGGTQPSSGKLAIPDSYTENGVKYSVAGVAVNALNGLDQVVEITIPESVRTIGSSSQPEDIEGIQNFQNCPSLKKFIVKSGNKKFKASAGGVLLSANGERLYRVPEAMDVDASGEFIVGKSVLFITDGAFADNARISTIVFSEELIEFADFPGFNSMKKLKAFSFSSPNDRYYISDGALIHTNLKSLLFYPPARTQQNVSINADLKYVGPYAFAATKHLVSISLPQKLVELQDYAFANSSIKEIDMPRKLKYVGTHCFAGSGLEKIDYYTPSESDMAAENIFAGCKYLTSITIHGSGYELNPGFARDCPRLKSVSFAGRAPVEIRESAFKNCVSLVNFPFGEKIDMDFNDSIFANTGFDLLLFSGRAENYMFGPYSFHGCKKLASVDFSNVSVSKDAPLVVPTRFIAGVPALKEVRFPAYTTFVGSTDDEISPNFGPGVKPSKIVIGAFQSVNDAIFGIASGKWRPDVYVKTTDAVAKYAPTEMLFSVIDGDASIKARMFCERAVPFRDYASPYATFYVPGGCSDNYSRVAEIGGSVKEMFSISAADAAGNMMISVKPNFDFVVPTYVLFNEKTGGKPKKDGTIDIGIAFDKVETVRVDYTVNGEKMSTLYKAEKLVPSGVDDIVADGEAKPTDVFNLQGIRVLSNATRDDIRLLPPGIYIAGGKKIVVTGR